VRPLVSFVIPVRNDVQRLRRCLTSIVSNDYPRALIELIVVDNDSEDGSGRAAREYGAIVLRSSGNCVAELRNVFALTGTPRPCGAGVGFARNGREALDYLHKNPEVDLVLMDIMMPEMDGIEATRALRKEQRFARLPIIALTAKAMADDRDKCIEAGANDYIAKPLDVDRLLSLARVWIRK